MSDGRTDAIAAVLAGDDGYRWENIAPYPKGEQYRQKALRILDVIAPHMAGGSDMSDERADAIPEAAFAALARHAIGNDWMERPAAVRALRAGVAAAAPHMAGNGEADTLRAIRHELSQAGILNPGEPLDTTVWRLRIRADAAMAEVERLRTAQPGAERAGGGEAKRLHGKTIEEWADTAAQLADGDPAFLTRWQRAEAEAQRLRKELQALVDWFNDAPFLRAEELLYQLSRGERAAQEDR